LFLQDNYHKTIITCVQDKTRFQSVWQSTRSEPSQLLTLTTEIQLIPWRLINEQLLMRRGNPLHRVQRERSLRAGGTSASRKKARGHKRCFDY